jgi:N6-adenosine-specific RNA methylase IME4
MDKSGRVNGPFKRLKVMRQAELIRAEPPPLPGNGPYRVIVADPPWPYEARDDDPSHRAARPYLTMSVSDICAVRVSDIAHEDCILWLWTTNHRMREAYMVLDAWGFTDRTILTWVKDRFGTGDWLRGQTEHCILAARGKPIVQLTNQSTVLFGPMRAHSQKPVEFYDFVEKLCPAPRYADLFSRYRHNEKWDVHGDEAPLETKGSVMINVYWHRRVRKRLIHGRGQRGMCAGLAISLRCCPEIAASNGSATSATSARS